MLTAQNHKSEVSVSVWTRLLPFASRRRGFGEFSSVGARGLVLCALCTFLLVAIFCPSFAFGKQVRLVSGSFGSATSTPADPYPLAEPAGNHRLASVAVDDATHDVYAGDEVNQRVEKFSASGEFILMFGKGVDQTTGAGVCTAASGDICKIGVPGASPGAFSAGESRTPDMLLAVDSSLGPSKGDVYVADSSDSVISKFDSSGHLIGSWGNNGPAEASDGQLNGSNAIGAVAGPFSLFKGIAVDTAGNLWVYDFNADVFEFSQSGSPITSWPAQGTIEGNIAVDAEDNLYLPRSLYVAKYGSAGNLLGAVANTNNDLEAIAVDQSSGELYLDTLGGIKRYASSCQPSLLGLGCEPVEVFGVGDFRAPRGIAVDPAAPRKTVYVATSMKGEVVAVSVETVPDVTTLKASGFTPTSVVLNGAVNPSGVALEEGLKGCRFEWGERGEGEQNPYGHTAPCEQSAIEIGSGSQDVPVAAQIAGLQAGRNYHFRLVAANANDVNVPSYGQDLVFGPPRVSSESVSNVTATGAVLEGEVSPQNVQARARLEYVSGEDFAAGGYTAGTRVPARDIDLGSGEASVAISQHVQGLAPNTVYHYRVVAESPLAEGAQAIDGPDHVFRTQGPAEFSLLDGRGWELVSPADKHGAGLLPIEETGVIQAAASGDAIAYLATAPVEAQPQGNANETQVLSSRGPGGWSSQDVALPHEVATGAALGYGQEYRFFSNDLSLGLVQPLGPLEPSLSPRASERTPFLRKMFVGGDVSARCASGCFEPLVTEANTTSGVPFGEAEPGPLFQGANADASAVVMKSHPSLLEGAPGVSAGALGGSLYEWSAGRLALVSVLPSTAPAPASSQPDLGSRGRMVRNAISNDGSRVVWSESGGSNHLYLRDLAREETLQLDLPGKGVSGGGAPEPVFQFASTDGSRVFFTDEQRLTGTAHAANHEPDLYECEVTVTEEGALACDLIDLTAVAAGGVSANVQGLLLGGSEDGSSVYFVADGRLSTNKDSAGEEAVEGTCNNNAKHPGSECNLYEYSGGVTKLVAVLAGAAPPVAGAGAPVHGDSLDWAAANLTLQTSTARVSPDGRWVAFMSERSLTGYDNRDVVSGVPDEEVFLFHDPSVAEREGGAVEGVVCGSCDPTGARPKGVLSGTLETPRGLTAGGQVWGTETWIAANVPAWTPYKLGVALYQSRYLSDEGRLFFNSSDALVSQDTNHTEDVYEYEPLGVGSCRVTTGTFSESAGGCVDLVSSGTSSGQSAFLDASESGGDVFFLTSAQLSGRDTDTALDVYDARIGGSEPVVPAAVQCQGDACLSPVSAPEDPTPGSLSFNGPGNVAPLVSPLSVPVRKVVKCRKATKLRHGKCVKSRKTKAKKRARKASHGRGGGR